VSAKLIRMTRDKRMEKDLLPAGGKESTEVIPKAVPFWNKDVWAFYSGRLRIFTQESSLRGEEHIPENAV
jgi:hypothetical protein